MNNIFHRDQVMGRYATLVYLQIDKTSGAVQILNAGHNPPVLLRSRTFEELPPVSHPLGLFPQVSFEEQRAELESGDFLLVYSDGVTEACNEKGEFFGEQRLMDLLPRLRGRSAEDAATLLLAEVETFIGEERLSDDLSLVFLKRL
jgi:serine phosphatase RsbU (regulator of sigma subunit)